MLARFNLASLRGDLMLTNTKHLLDKVAVCIIK